MTKPDRQRASSFGAAAAAYAEHRPDYPVAAIEWGLAGRTPDKVLDLGAGTGKLTRILVGLGFDVVAVEPDEQMRAQLSALLPGVAAPAGRAERIPLPDGSVDAVFVGQALHWFDLDVAMPEIERVLRPGGVLIALWNARDGRATPWLAGLDQLLGRTGLTAGKSEDRSFPVFGTPEQHEVPHAHRRTAESLVETLSTESHLLVLPADERAQLRQRISAYLASRPETASGEFDVPLATLVARFTRPR
jgi:SAM-dependent methyltransferase